MLNNCFFYFRCNIPVILMGETGCGKTRLLKYLCDLQGKTFNTKNMLCLKVCIRNVLCLGV